MLLIVLVLAGSLRADGFQRGINLSHWYAQTLVGHYDESHLATYFTKEDAELIAKSGLDHVRLTVEPAIFFIEDQPEQIGGVSFSRERLRQFHERVRWLLDAELNVIIDVHPSDNYKASLNTPQGRERFVKHWWILTNTLGKFDPDRVRFEIMNEPHNVDDWRSIQKEVIEAIRPIVPRHTIIVTAGGWSHAASLYGDEDDQNHKPTQPFEPYDVENLVYTFHYYEPFMFTHQGAGWAWPPAMRTKGLPWPIEAGDADLAEDIARRTTTDDEAFGHVRFQIENGYFTKAWTRERFEKVAAWRDEHDVEVYLGEFGVFAPHAPRDSRLAWTDYVTDLANEFEFGYAMWDYSGGFALFPGKPGERKADREVLNLLLGEGD
jgi:aryl-phospho-beta-D-glucosidase BglC (GH1 family)